MREKVAVRLAREGLIELECAQDFTIGRTKRFIERSLTAPSTTRGASMKALVFDSPFVPPEVGPLISPNPNQIPGCIVL
jgi:hypothetical protein